MNYYKLMMLLLAMTFGQAHAQRVEVKSNVINVGQVLFRAPVSAEFELKNTSGHPCIINKVRTSCGCTTVEYPHNAVAGGETFTVKATYDAAVMGHFEKQVAIYSNADNEPLYLTMKGIVVDEVVDFVGEYPYKLGELMADANNIEFDNVNQGDRPYVRFHIMNNSSRMAEPVVMHLPKYLKAEVSPSKVAPSRTGVVTIQLNSNDLRDYGLTQTTVFLGLFPGDRVATDKAIDVSAVLLPYFGEMTAAEVEQAPRIELSASQVQFDRKGKRKQRADILLTNVGKSELDISSLQMFTTGLQVSLNKTKLKPEETAHLRITGEIKELVKLHSKPRVLMITNDPTLPKVVVGVTVK
ncbi:MAG: DUF1573 domain-containing protein [Prevotella sp.]|nr:DUF1573 domain-containing protein [Prevotella sp.]